MTTATLTLPPVTPEFQRIVRTLGCEIGWKNVARRIAFGPTLHAVTQGITPKAKRNGHKDYMLAWYDARGLHLDTYQPERGTDGKNAWELACERAHELDATRYQRPIPAPFTPARRMIAKALDKTDIRLALYRGATCCGQPMGVIESWQNDVLPMYQCAVNAKHTKLAVPKVAGKGR